MTQKISILTLGFRQEWNALSIALKNDESIEHFNAASALDILKKLPQSKICLIIACLARKEDLIEIGKVMKFYKRLTSSSVVKITVLNQSGEKTYEKSISKLGIQDIIDPLINPKALRFKIDFWIRGMNLQLQKLESNETSKTTISTADEKPFKSYEDVRWIEPLDLENDIWIFDQKTSCKRILGKWVIKVKGPSPFVSQWVEVNGKQNVWRLDFKKEERELYISSKGDWFFRGDQKPEFNWKENIWLITGSGFDLIFMEDEVIHTRLILKNKTLTVCKNSEYALTKENLIQSSFEKNITFNKNNLIKTNEEISREEGIDGLNNLDGKAKSDKYQQNNLSGKGGAADQVGGKPMSLELKNHQDHISDKMKGPAGDKHRAGDELSTEIDENEIDAFYKNLDLQIQEEKRSSDFSSPTSPDVRSGDDLEIKNDKNKLNKYLRKDLNEDAVQKKEGSKGKSNEKEKRSGDYSGEGNTERLSSYYKNDSQKNNKTDNSPKINNKNEKNKKQNSKNQNISKDEDSFEDLDMSDIEKELKSLEDDFLIDPENKKSKNLESKNQKELRGSNLSGNSSTDKIDSFYSKKKNSNPDNSKDAPVEEWAKLFDTPKKKNDNSKNSDQKKLKNKVFSDSGAMGGDEFEENTTTFAAPATLFGKGIDYKNKASKQESNDKVDDKKDSDNVVSIEEARKQKELDQLINKNQEDYKEINESFETAQIISILTQNDKEVPCSLDDYFDRTIVFTTKVPGIDTSSEVAMDLSFRYLKKVARLNFKGIVSHLDDDSEGIKYISVEIGEESVTAFDSFMKLYQMRQKNIEFFLKKAKGH